MSAASVWIRFSISRTVRARSDRPSALTTPAVTVCWKPNGLPIAITTCPGRKRRRVAERRGGELWRGDAQHRQVGVRIVADEIGAEHPAVGERHRDFVAAGDDVAVGQDEAVGREDESRSRPAAARRLAARPRLRGRDVHLDDGGPDALHGSITARE